MAVRITLGRRPDDAPNGRRAERVGRQPSIGLALRNRFGFSLLREPLLRSGDWIEECGIPERRPEALPEPVPIRPSRPLEEELELSLLLRGHPVGPRA